MRLHLIAFNVKLLTLTILACVVFYLFNQLRIPPHKRLAVQSTPQVVISAPIQVLMYFGERHLAANLEAMRIAAVGPSEDRQLALYRVRSYKLISDLNPCHEDNMYLSNAMLTWGGGVETAISILEQATECRSWDWMPPFFLGFNRYFFHRDLDGAIQAMNIAADRNKEGSASLQKTAIVMASEKFDDEKIAADYLRSERDSATDPQLVQLLDRRLKRLEGLLVLRDAQVRFEKKMRQTLSNPEELIASGIISAYPEDPTKIGYEFVNGKFQLRALKISGVEIR